MDYLVSFSIAQAEQTEPGLHERPSRKQRHVLAAGAGAQHPRGTLVSSIAPVDER